MNWRRKTNLALITFYCFSVTAWAVSGDSSPALESAPLETIASSSSALQSQTVLELKLQRDSGYRLEDNALVSDARSDRAAQLAAVLAQFSVQRVDPLFPDLESDFQRVRNRLEQRTGQELPDLALWFRLQLSPQSDITALIKALEALPDVETAYPAPLPAPPPTPDFTSQQGYLDTGAMGGIDARYAWSFSGGTGDQVTVVDIEYAFNPEHEDLPDVPVIGGVLWDYYGDDHGTAVLGELAGVVNDYGVSGIAHQAAIKFASPCSSEIDCNYNPAAAINTAREATAEGDVILIEQQYPACNSSNYGPLEWMASVFDAVQVATASGRHVVAAAGNGALDLDAPGCQGRFDRDARDSGAIIVGAGAPPDYPQAARSRLSFSTYGSRVDLQGWGRRVVTAGYGDLHGAGNSAYTALFSGTSSASPIVAGAVALLSSIEQQKGTTLTPSQVRQRLVSTGLPQQDAPDYPASEHIGPLPDLQAVLATEAVLNGECLLDWAETEYSELLAPAGAETIEAPPYHYRAYADTNALLGISDADHRLYYQGSDQVLVDLGPLSTWLETADCLPPPTACLFDWVEQTYPDAFAPAGAETTLSYRYSLRYYPGTNAYLALDSGDGHIWYQIGAGEPGDAGSYEALMAQSGCGQQVSYPLNDTGID